MSQIITCTRKIYKNHKLVAVSLRWRVTRTMDDVGGDRIAYFGIRMNRAGTTFGKDTFICTSRILEQSMESQRWTLTEEAD